MGCSYYDDCASCAVGRVIGCKSWAEPGEASESRVHDEETVSFSTCSSCKGRLEAGWSFCPFCGRRLSDGASACQQEARSETLIPAKKNGTRGAHLQAVRTIVSRTTGASNFVLEFDDDAEVIMPGTFTIRESEFPNGIYQGQKLAAYWEVDEGGIERFHLYEV